MLTHVCDYSSVNTNEIGQPMTSFPANVKFQVIDRQTGAVVGTFKNKQAARNKRDRMDSAYGAVRYTVREVAA